jgi:hypothetical protein
MRRSITDRLDQTDTSSARVDQPAHFSAKTTSTTHGPILLLRKARLPCLHFLSHAVWNFGAAGNAGAAGRLVRDQDSVQTLSDGMFRFRVTAWLSPPSNTSLVLPVIVMA